MITMVPCVLVESLFGKGQMVLFEHGVPLIPLPTDYPDPHENDHGWVTCPMFDKTKFQSPHMFDWYPINRSTHEYPSIDWFEPINIH